MNYTVIWFTECLFLRIDLHLVPYFPSLIQLNSNNDTPVKYIITTCMDPWATSTEFMKRMASVIRNSILCAVGRVRANSDVIKLQVLHYT